MSHFFSHGSCYTVRAHLKPHLFPTLCAKRISTGVEFKKITKAEGMMSRKRLSYCKCVEHQCSPNFGILIKSRRRRCNSYSCSLLQMMIILVCTLQNAVAQEDSFNLEQLYSKPDRVRILQTSDSPTVIPSSLLSTYPTESHSPTSTPSQELTAPPTAIKSSLPTNVPSEVPTAKPSRVPTISPTSRPSITSFPSHHPTQTPSRLPSMDPTVSMIPSLSPSNVPSSLPSISSEPSVIPSSIPSSQPSYSVPFEEKIVLITTFFSLNRFDNEDPDEERIFTDVMSSFTPYLGQIRDPNHIDTICEVISSKYASSGSGGQAIVQYSMEFKSNRENITGYDDRFFEFIQANATLVVDELKNASMQWSVESISFTGRANTESPTKSPSYRPSVAPTNSPSKLPSLFPSYSPSERPSISQAPNERPSNTPTLSAQPSIRPTSQPTVERKSENMGAIVGGTIGAAAFLLLFFLGRRRRSRNAGQGLFSFAGPWNRKGNSETDDFQNPTSTSGSPVGIISDNHSIVSRDSLLSVSSGHNDSDSDIEYGGNSVFHDEFEKYKDENMEKMRKQVVESLTDCGDMVNLALTKALMDDLDDDDENDDITSPEGRNGIEIEATVLCEMMDWMKKTEHANADERREIMQGTLNDMVSNVLRGIMSSDDGSRIIHGAAAILGLQLEANIPETTLIVTGMRKKATRKDMVEAFKEFGDIEDAAVSSNSRGFGIVRYSSPKSVQRAMDRFRTGEIVVQDVAIMIRVLKQE